MIEVISEERCTKCDVCIRVCPTDVFDRGPEGFPVLTRQEDCQTCFLCEAWCPQDAVFVAHPVTPLPEDSELLDPDHLTEHDLFGGYRRAIGWSIRRPPAGSPEADPASASTPLPQGLP